MSFLPNRQSLNRPNLAQGLETATFLRDDPRAHMAARLPASLQPLLTLITAKPAPGEETPERSPIAFVAGGLLAMLIGAGLSATAIAVAMPLWLASLLLFVGLTATASGLGLYQVVVFHHCSHGTVFPTRSPLSAASRSGASPGRGGSRPATR